MPVLIHVHQRASGLSDGQAKDYDLSLDGNSSVADLKDAIRDKSGVPVDLQSLYHHNPVIKGEGASLPLTDEMTLHAAFSGEKNPRERHLITLYVDESGMPEISTTIPGHGRTGR